MTDKQKIKNMLQWMDIPQSDYYFDGNKVLINAHNSDFETWDINPDKLYAKPLSIYAKRRISGDIALVLEYAEITETPAGVLKEVFERKGHKVSVVEVEGLYWVNIDRLVIDAEGLEEIYLRTGLCVFSIYTHCITFSKP